MKTKVFFIVSVLAVAILSLPAFASQTDELIKRQNAQISAQAVEYLGAVRIYGENASFWKWSEFSGGTIAIANDNLGGVIGLALLKVYSESGNLRPLQLARDYAEKFYANYKEKGIKNIRLIRPTIKFFAEFASVTGEYRYQRLASDMMAEYISTHKTAKGMLYKYYMTNFKIEKGRIVDDLARAGYDIAWDIKALKATGYHDLAYELAVVAAEEMPLWLPRDIKNSPWGMISAGAFASALADVDARVFSEVLVRLGDALVGSQDENGAWANNETQVTSYALLGLKAVGKPEYKSAIGKAETWLLGTILPNGAWGSYHDGIPQLAGEIYPMVHSEALTALLTR